MGVSLLCGRFYFCIVREQRCHRESFRSVVRASVSYSPTAHLLHREEVSRTL